MPLADIGDRVEEESVEGGRGDDVVLVLSFGCCPRRRFMVYGGYDERRQGSEPKRPHTHIHTYCTCILVG